MAVCISGDAVSLLMHEPAECMKLYVAICQIMDWQTFTAGETRRMNEAFFRESLEVSQVNGRKRQIPTRQKWRSALERLKNLGLLIDKGDFVFELPYEAADSFVQKRYNQGLNQKAQSKIRENGFNNNELEEAATKAKTIGATHILYPSIHPSIGRDSEEKPHKRFRMSLDWKPSENFINQVDQAWQPNAQQVTALKAKKFGFILYWITQDIELTQGEWEQKLWRNELEKVLTAPPLPSSVAGANVRPISSARQRKPMPKALAVPEHLWGKVLERWGVQHGFRPFNKGEEDDQYKQYLRVQCERYNIQREREAMGANKA